MVNLDKWEEIEYEDVRKGDKLRVITTQRDVVNDTKGVASEFYSYRGWVSESDVTLLTSRERFKPIAGGYRKIYRRKQKEQPFDFPGKFGEVVSGVGKASGRRYNFINIGRGRYLRDDAVASHGSERLAELYTDFKLEKEGITK